MIKKDSTTYDSDFGANEVVGSLLLIGIIVIFGTMVGGFIVSQVQNVPKEPDAEVAGSINESENTVNFTVQKMYSDQVIFRGGKDCSGEKTATSSGEKVSFDLPSSGDVCRVTVVAETDGTEQTVDVFEKQV